MFTNKQKRVLFIALFVLSAFAGYQALKVLTPVGIHHQDLSGFPEPAIVQADTTLQQLALLRYRQIGREIYLLAYANAPGLAPFSATVSQVGASDTTYLLLGGPSAWLRFTPHNLGTGAFLLKLRSTKDTACSVTAQLHYEKSQKDELADAAHWYRHGSHDDLLDVRVLHRDGRYYLKDFADYHDGRTRTYFLEGAIVDDLENGLEVQPGYLYSVAARWIDGDYSQWWNRAKNRTSRLQVVWIDPDSTTRQPGSKSILSPVPIPRWFKPSQSFNPRFDTLFPEFEAAPGKLAMMYRLNLDQPASAYFNRGVTHLPRWEHEAPADKQHWTEAPGFFEDRDQDWFGSLTQHEVENYADRVGKIGAYAFDFEFWNRHYTPAVKQRLLWFSKRLRDRNPDIYLFDYWGGSAYHNTTFQDKDGVFSPSGFLRDYQKPKSNHFNFEPTSNGDFFGRYFNITGVDVYPRPPLVVGKGRYTLNNYLVLSGIHATRVNRLFDFQKQNKTLWFAWNRFMPLYQDPPFLWQVETTDPEGKLVFSGLETMPASQALAISLFSLIEGDGYYLWSDSQPWGKGVNNYRIQDNPALHAATGWWPNDGVKSATDFSVAPGASESPRYWDYVSDYFALGNWMAATVGHILKEGARTDLAFGHEKKWHEPVPEQAAMAASRHLPFVTSVVKDDRIVVLAMDSFQAPNATRQLQIQLPDGRKTEINLFGNWPSLYQGKLNP